MMQDGKLYLPSPLYKTVAAIQCYICEKVTIKSWVLTSEPQGLIFDENHWNQQNLLLFIHKRLKWHFPTPIPSAVSSFLQGKSISIGKPMLDSETLQTCLLEYTQRILICQRLVMINQREAERQNLAGSRYEMERMRYSICQKKVTKTSLLSACLLVKFRHVLFRTWSMCTN